MSPRSLTDDRLNELVRSLDPAPAEADPRDPRARATLARIVATDSAPVVRPTQRRRVGVALVAVAAASVALLVVPGLGTTPAYSVREGNAGEIEVRVNRMEDSAGLENALREAGIEADVTYVPDGGTCRREGVELVERRLDISLEIGLDRFQVTLGPGTVRDGETLVIDGSIVATPPGPEVNGVQNMGGSRSWVSAEVVRGDPGTCVPLTN